MTINQPGLVAAIEALHDAYERALLANDVAALDAHFWQSPSVVRYGVDEQLYGVEDLRAYRGGPAPRFSSRRIIRRVISTFGDATATVMCEVAVTIAGVERTIRQSQTWIAVPGSGWRIVAAHVSAPARRASDWAAFADAAAARLGLPLDSDGRAAVVGNLERTAAIAAPLLAWTAPDDLEPAPVFTA